MRKRTNRLGIALALLAAVMGTTTFALAKQETGTRCPGMKQAGKATAVCPMAKKGAKPGAVCANCPMGKKAAKPGATVCAAADPVCGMKMSAKGSFAGKSAYKGKTYLFCSKSCKASFDKQPGKYAK